IDAAARRAEWPRIGEVPFDSAHKLMATVHEREEGGLWLFAKGAPDALLDRAACVLGADGELVPIEDLRDDLVEHNARLADSGMRVLAIARREIGRDEWEGTEERLDAVRDLTLLALVGIVDPPRPEVAAAIAEAHQAGIRVKMITGDHPSTAASIGNDLGLAGT